MMYIKCDLLDSSDLSINKETDLDEYIFEPGI
jgi:hypothetical protein